MFRGVKSNKNSKYDKFLNLSAVLLCSFAASSCNTILTETNYASSVDGYEDRVSLVNYEQAKEIKSSSERFARVGAPPVIINNPLAISENIGSGLASSGAFTNGVFMPAQSSGGSAYGSLNSGVIQQGIFMPSSGSTVNPANNFGNNFLSPARR